MSFQLYCTVLKFIVFRNLRRINAMHLNVFNGMSVSCVPLVPNVANNTSPVIVTRRYSSLEKTRNDGNLRNAYYFGGATYLLLIKTIFRLCLSVTSLNRPYSCGVKSVAWVLWGGSVGPCVSGRSCQGFGGAGEKGPARVSCLGSNCGDLTA